MAATPDGKVDSLRSASQDVTVEDPCWKIFDAFMYCMTPTNQLAHYYTYGIPDYCPDYFNKWTTCLKFKLKKPEEAERMRREVVEKERIGHLWSFRPAYANEARATYGPTVKVDAQEPGRN